MDDEKFGATDQAYGKRLLLFWLGVALFLTLTNNLIWLRQPFTYFHGWHAADQAVAARNFNRQGVIRLRGIPLRNNPPLGNEPDFYIHWPPLAPILLSFVFRIFGESEAAYHGWSIFLLLAFCLTLYALVRTCYGVREAVFAVFVSLTAPVTISYAHLLGNASLTILLMMLSILGFIKASRAEPLHRGWALLGIVSLAIGVWTSWFPLLVAPGLIAISLWQRERSRIRLALVYAVVGAAMVLSIMALYLYNAPGLADDLWHTALSRMGLGSFGPARFRVHSVVEDGLFSNNVVPSPLRILRQYAYNFMAMIGQLPALALAWVLMSGWVSRREKGCEAQALLFCGLLSPWALWFILMRQHAYMHNIAMQLAVPACSAAMGVAVIKLNGAARNWRVKNFRPAHALLLIVLPLVMLVPLVSEIDKRRNGPPQEENHWLMFSREIKDATEREAIVLVPPQTMTTIYYSDRHLIRGVGEDATVEKVVERLPELFPGSPVYLALPADYFESTQFSRSAEKYRLVKSTKEMRLYAISNGGTSRATGATGAEPGARDGNMR